MMKKQMKRTVYEAPVTERFSVELEGNLMAASVVHEGTKSGVETTGQELNDIDLAEVQWNDGAVGENGWNNN